MHELRPDYDLSLLLRAAQLARSTYYYQLKSRDRLGKYAPHKQRLSQLYQQHQGRYGYRRLTSVLRAEGYTLNHKTVFKLLGELQLRSRIRLKKYRSYRGEKAPTTPNLLNREFTAEKPFAKWVTDVTEFKVGAQKLYLSPILDLYNGEIVSYDLSERANFKQVSRMLEEALAKLPAPTRLLLHSDQGWQYQMKPYQRRLKKQGLIQSMSRKGNCLDNAVMENFFGTLKSELFYLNSYECIQALEKDIRQYIHYYNHQRIRLNLQGMSPVDFRINAGF
ncbi:IS3 family transposase [Siphonobacter sp. SORGH_AS_0500]|uniref:IS3 family transposase n=1 Tax=Siphonobacter sp. SORGH_AS_0500 TaxID=1864824 RepID=UPI00285FDD11|nr:IS3 family transposase [Siphonobacter sp. SORGH_AS_0500]MDR6192999.1 putative transposase [Siphonobacter sp. SORGH_AS_0500]MDR6193551.1 putative transposase [Siphonobacter sp. SORGH_AS_0500]MDR6195431.1 putative transposase [Siphonobacter sp. SORGH_AS_0500]MDR6195514.1 putative transposase [Siphonobacter sp. SORGH_AS_0500]MDR6196569.1 putative transposase [Siphonobacter sp. SORGH_AS_0500]